MRNHIRWSDSISAIHHSRFTIHQSRSGFTLVEIITVIAIIGILAGMILSGAMYMQEKAGRSRTIATIKGLEAALENYKGDFGVYPPDFVGRNLRSYAGISRVEGRLGTRYGSAGNTDPAECLWYHLEQAMYDLGRRPYATFRNDQLCDRDNDKNMEVADGFSYPINYKSNYPANTTLGYWVGYEWGGASILPGQARYAPRHHHDSFDLCSYGRDNTTWKTYDQTKRTGTMFSPSELSFGGAPENYYKVPFDRLGDRSGRQYCYAGEGDDDINNWQQRD